MTPWNLPKLITKTSGINTGSTLAYDYDASHARIKEVSTLHGTTYYAGGYELVIPTSSTAAQNQTEERTYLSSPEGTVGVITQKTTANATGGPTTSTDTAYWHKDHLGSLAAITNYEFLASASRPNQHIAWLVALLHGRLHKGKFGAAKFRASSW